MLGEKSGAFFIHKKIPIARDYFYFLAFFLGVAGFLVVRVPFTSSFGLEEVLIQLEQTFLIELSTAPILLKNIIVI